MSKKESLSVVPKSERRTWIIEQLLSAIKSDEIFHTLDYRNKTEAYIKQYMHQILKRCLLEIHRRISPGQKEDTLKRKASDSLMWEGDVNTTINHIRFLGVQHRPDFKVRVDGLNIAIEVKRGDSGAGIREGIGQSLVYAASEDFDFVVYLFIDISKDKKILESLRRDRERAFVDSLWDKYNIRFDII
ncbi:MAG: hypothetical protein KJ550_01345 [Proteobacteria bacterium]|nr:hypothetical protein [Desulfobacteraceae bacterium]MBU4012092.1 hypothetical protein [Pseudomonadota bacterium]MBU4068909.1 hypothetical protein [Pseudomonadota bacterium]MBU4128116.1 hypothetical protein [Pseudomonadota bacterium]